MLFVDVRTHNCFGDAIDQVQILETVSLTFFLDILNVGI